MGLLNGTGGSSSSGGSSGGSGSSGFDYDAEITALQIVAEKIPSGFTINTLSIMKEDINNHKLKFTYIPSNKTFNPETWDEVTEAIKKISSVFTVNTFQELYDYVTI
jgi:DUF2075 family protein